MRPRLNELREGWLNAPSGEPDVLEKRTLTNLYNEMPTWLRDAHATLDGAVLAAYGWPADISEEELLRRLLDLNLEGSTAPSLPAAPADSRDGMPAAEEQRHLGKPAGG